MEAVESAVSQDPPPVEVLIVDDGSPAPVACDHPLVRVIRQTNSGASAARNRGACEARGDLIAFLDADDTWRPGKLAAQLPLIDGDVGLCTTAFDLLHPDGSTSPGYGAAAGDYRQMLGGVGLSSSTVLVRRATLADAGGFDERLRRAEDWDAWLRLSRVTRFAHVPQPLTTYRQHRSGASENYRAMWRASMRVLWKHRRALPVAGVRRMGQIYGAQAFDAFRATRRPSHLAWASVLWPDYVARQVWRQVSGAAHARPR